MLGSGDPLVASLRGWEMADLGPPARNRKKVAETASSGKRERSAQK